MVLRELCSLEAPYKPQITNAQGKSLYQPLLVPVSLCLCSSHIL